MVVLVGRIFPLGLCQYVVWLRAFSLEIIFRGCCERPCRMEMVLFYKCEWGVRSPGSAGQVDFESGWLGEALTGEFEATLANSRTIADRFQFRTQINKDASRGSNFRPHFRTAMRPTSALTSLIAVRKEPRPQSVHNLLQP